MRCGPPGACAPARKRVSGATRAFTRCVDTLVCQLKAMHTSVRRPHGFAVSTCTSIPKRCFQGTRARIARSTLSITLVSSFRFQNSPPPGATTFSHTSVQAPKPRWRASARGLLCILLHFMHTYSQLSSQLISYNCGYVTI